MGPIRVLVVDDHYFFRRGLVGYLAELEDFDVVGEAADGEEGLEKAKELLPDLIVMDIYMRGLEGLEATRRIKAAVPRAKVVILTISEEDHNVFEAIKAGAEGYIVKDVRPQELFDLLKRIAQGETLISPSTAAKILKEVVFGAPGRAPGEALVTARELEVLELVSQGRANKEIALALGLSEHTVKRHLEHILKKLHLRSRVAAALYAVKKGWIAPDAGEVSRGGEDTPPEGGEGA